MKRAFKKIAQASLFLLVFSFPIFFLPFSPDLISYPKTLLLFFLLTLAFFSWFLSALFQKKISFFENKLFYLSLFLVLFFLLISTIFSQSKTASFWGFPLELSRSFLTLFFLVLFSFLFVHLLKEKTELSLSFFLLLISGFFLCLFSIFQLYKQKSFFGIFLFNPFGPLSALSIFFALLIPISLSFFFQAKGFWRLLFGIFTISFLFFLAISGIKISYLLLFLISVFLLTFSIEKDRGEIDLFRATCFSLLLIFSIFFYFFPLKLPFAPQIPSEVSLGFPAQIPIIKGVFSEGIKEILFGSGPGTFIFAYSKYRPLTLNQSLFWGTRFSLGSSTVFDWLVENGLLATFSLIFLFAILLFLIFKNILQKKGKISLLAAAIFSSLFGLIIISFFYSFNLSLWFLFWLFVGASLTFLKKEKEIDFSAIPFSKTFFFLISFTIFSFTFIVSAFHFQKYLAHRYYKLALVKTPENLDLAIESLKKATQLNPQADLYWRELSQLLLFKANQISQDENISLEEKKEKVNKIISDGIVYIEKAVQLSPQNVANWNVRGYFYRNLIGGFQMAGELALDSYRKAIQLEPSSPYSFGEMGRVYILMAQDFERKGQIEAKKEALSLAKKMLEEAIEKKPDYAPAHYLMAVVASQEGKETEAIAKLEETIKLAPSDFGLRFQLALLYYRTNQLDKAEKILKETLNQFPNYSNARYLLGLVYDKKGEKKEAKNEFEIVLKMNPDNEEVKKILENLEKNLPALEGILTPKTLSEEKPTELQP